MSQTQDTLPHKEIGVAVIYNEQGQILIDRRLEEGTLGGLWEFPGGKIEAQETVQECIEREILEEIGIAIAVEEHLLSLSHSYSHFHVTLHVYQCRHLRGIPQTLECQEIRWVRAEELEKFSFPEANRQIIATLLAKEG